jgi:hypothetical protein
MKALRAPWHRLRVANTPEMKSQLLSALLILVMSAALFAAWLWSR